MKQVCLRCARTAPDYNLFCQEIRCPAEMSPSILEYGERLGDIEIIRPMIVLRTAALYEVNHQDRHCYLKVAHPGEENKDRLKREAEFLGEIQRSLRQNKYLPVLLPPYQNTNIREDPYGKVMLQGHLLYFFLFEYFEGEPLRYVLMKTPQLWINHVGWIMLSLTNVIAFLHSKNRYHLGLSPESFLMRIDKETNAPRILLFDLGVASDAPRIHTHWQAFFTPLAYLAPELIEAKALQATPAQDVYGLGLILYEMLVGEPAYTYKLQSDEAIAEAVRLERHVRMNRIEDVRPVAEIALLAVSPQPERRQPTVNELAKQLKKHFPSLPPEKQNRWPTLDTLMLVIGGLLIIAFLVTLAVTLV